MPLQQLNLKLPPEVAAHWSAQAQAEGLSVRDWLIARVGPAAAPAAAAGAELLDRVAALERSTAELAGAVAQLQAAPRRSPRRETPPITEGVEPLRVPPVPGQLEIIGAGRLHPPEPITPAGQPPSPERVNQAPAAIPRTGEPPSPAGGIPTAELAQLLGVSRHSLNERVRRMGGAREGLELEGWRCCGQLRLPRGGPARWLWEPVEA